MSLDFVGAFSAQRSQVFSREELVGFLMSWRGGACSTGRRSDLREQDLQGVGCRQNWLLAMSRVNAAGHPRGVPASRKDWLLMLVSTVRRSLCSIHSAVNEGSPCVRTRSYSRFLGEEAEALSRYLVSTPISL